MAVPIAAKEDCRQVTNSHTGPEFSPFLETWFRGRHRPTYRLGYVTRAAAFDRAPS